MLWAQVLKAKYFPYTTLFTNTRSLRGSYIWRAFSIGIKLLLEGISWIVGDGHTIQFWKDPWLPKGTLRSYICGEFRVFLWRILLESLIHLYGPTTMVPIQLNLPLNFFIINNKCLWINWFGTRFGLYNVQKRSKFSFRKLCATGCPQNNS